MASTGITLHHLEASRSIRIAWLLEELKAPYTLKTYQRLPSKLAPPELIAIHPLGKSPVIVDNSVSPPVTVAESGAIIEYLTEKFAPTTLVPKTGSPEKLKYTYWLHASEGTVAPPLVQKVIYAEVVKNVPFPLSTLLRTVFGKINESVTDPNTQKSMALLESDLTQNKFVAGPEFTAADIQLYQTVRMATLYSPTLVGPKTRAWLDALREREAFKKVANLE
ncbi:hypothetical protein HDU98_001192 [Podochytrium sp. JEL0797]|nr:hypothetical protein HDU98_001192 [Podochytrium sp. JEL0797]